MEDINANFHKTQATIGIREIQYTVDVGGNLEAIDRRFKGMLTRYLRANGLLTYDGGFGLHHNVCKCCVTENLPPSMKIVMRCGDRWLLKEIEIVSHEVIVCLGRLAGNYVERRRVHEKIETYFLPHPQAIRGYEEARRFCERFCRNN